MIAYTQICRRERTAGSGGLRTALLLAAILLDRDGIRPPTDWMRVAQGLATLEYGNRTEAIDTVRALLTAEPR